MYSDVYCYYVVDTTIWRGNTTMRYSDATNDVPGIVFGIVIIILPIDCPFDVRTR